MKQIIHSLTFLLITTSALASHGGAAGAGPAAEDQQKVFVTSDGTRMPITAGLFEQLRSGLLASLACTLVPEKLQATAYWTALKTGALTPEQALDSWHRLAHLDAWFARGKIPLPETDERTMQQHWHRLATFWNELPGNEISLPDTDERTMQQLLNIATNTGKLQEIVVGNSTTQLIRLYQAAAFLQIDQTIQTSIFYSVMQALPRDLRTTSKADFNTFFHNTVIHLMPRNSTARSALSLHLAQHIRPTITTVPAEHGAIGIIFAPDGTLAYRTDKTDKTDYQTLYVYDRTKQQSTRIQDYVDRFAFAPDDGTLAYTTCIGAADGLAFYVYDHTTCKPMLISQDWVVDFSFASHGKLAYKTSHNELYVCDRTTQRSSRIANNVISFSCAPDGTVAYTTASITEIHERGLYLYNHITGTYLHIQDYVDQFSFAPDGTLAYITSDSTLYLYDRTTRQSARILGYVHDFSFAFDGTLAYTTTGNKLYLYNRTTQNFVRICDNIEHFAFALDGTLAYIATDNNLYLYDRTTQSSVRVCDNIEHFAFAPDGTLAIMNCERRIQLLDFTHGLDTAQQLFMLYVLINKRAGYRLIFTPQEIEELWKDLLKKIPELQHKSLLDGLPDDLRAHIHSSYADTDSGAGGAGPA